MKRFTKIMAAVMAIIMFLGVGFEELPVAAVTAINISGATKPTTLITGSSFTCAGTISSSSKLTLVTGQIITNTGTSKYVKSVNPNSTMYELKNGVIDSALLFNKLPAGNYYYKISAKNASGADQLLVNQAFTVQDPASTLGISGYSTPGTIEKGKSWNLKGTVTSNYPINNVTGYIQTTGGVNKYKQSTNPNSTSFSLAGSVIDAALLFNMLDVGTYVYKVTATDTHTSSAKTLINATFTVKKPASKLKISNQKEPGSLVKGTKWTTVGKITSNYNITKVTGYILASDGTTKKYSKSVEPNDTTFQLKGSDINTALKFDKLDTGSYIYKVTAKDASGEGAKVLIEVPFKVTKQPSKDYSTNIAIVLKDFADGGSNKFVKVGVCEQNKIWSWFYNKNMTRDASWCGAFTAYMMSLAGVDTVAIQNMAKTLNASKDALTSVSSAVKFYLRNDENAKNNCFYPMSGYTDIELVANAKEGSFDKIKTGDLLTVHTSNGPFSHIGIAYVDAKGKKYIVHGNWGDKVCKNEIKMNAVDKKCHLYYSGSEGEAISGYIDIKAFLKNNGMKPAYSLKKIEDIPTYTIGSYTLGGNPRQ